MLGYRIRTLRCISIHAPPRGATGNSACASALERAISIHAPPRGATELQVLKGACPKFQFTPLREGRRGSQARRRLPFGYFNSRPSARGDPCLLSGGSQLIFQFTPLREGRRLVAAVHAFAQRISIHAPPRGATLRKSRGCIRNLFQFTPLREGRRRKCMTTMWQDLFQFTPLREGRRVARLSRRALRHFNSRPSARGDVHGREKGTGTFISIHAPPRGATHTGHKVVAVGAISIHAPPRGATQRSGCRRTRARYFNSRPSARGDSSVCPTETASSNFNSRPSARGDAFGNLLCEAVAYFNSRPSARGDSGLDAHAGGRAAQFQFTPLREGRPSMTRKAKASRMISIHAPPRGAT